VIELFYICLICTVFFSYKNSDDNSLVITSASVADTGTYVCTAVNPAGEGRKAMALFVQGLLENMTPSCCVLY